MEIDLHGYSPDDLGCRYGAEDGGLVQRIVQQAWEIGEAELCLIHGRNRGISPGFVNTNTGFFGVCIRRALRQNNKTLRQRIKHTTLDCSDMGVTSIRLKPNPAPTRKALDCLDQIGRCAD